MKKLIKCLKIFPPATRSMFKAALLLAFYGFLRCSEYSVTNYNRNTCLRRKDVKFSTNGEYGLMKIKLRCTKTDQYSTTPVNIYGNGQIDCPLEAMRNYLDTYIQRHTSPLFCLGGKPLTPIHFNQLLRKACNLNKHVYTYHSLSSAAASTAADSGVPGWLIQKLGRWKSDCFKIYIPKPRKAMQVAQCSMAHCE